MPKATISIDVEGVAKAIDNLKSYQLIKQQAVKDILKKNGFKIESYAKEMCPYDTGRLRASISTNWSGSSMDKGKVGPKAKKGDGVGRPDGKPGMSVVVGSNVKYAPFQEFGTKKMSARPHLHPAYFMFEGQIVKEISTALKKVKK